eukprot:TRINITY_DN3853_c0_g4_i1.p1 TRINITY_DN3853_c0_g4~~TRINITY_DN3853_c0_g4_i1.p1  ORF type:complete len:143 (+),score=26.38 TRINITY_DN3853_c0_g4_i1:104-532(+)
MALVNGYVFIMVGKSDTPLYEAEFPYNTSIKRDAGDAQVHFTVHAALDTIDEKVWQSGQMYLKVVEELNDNTYISAFVTAGHVRLMMLQSSRNEDGIKNFFNEVYELYLKILLNPFYTINSRITSPQFHKRVEALGKKYLTG